MHGIGGRMRDFGFTIHSENGKIKRTLYKGRESELLSDQHSKAYHNLIANAEKLFESNKGKITHVKVEGYCYYKTIIVSSTKLYVAIESPINLQYINGVDINEFVPE